jgi:hypothetical protein
MEIARAIPHAHHTLDHDHLVYEWQTKVRF